MKSLAIEIGLLLLFLLAVIWFALGGLGENSLCPICPPKPGPFVPQPPNPNPQPKPRPWLTSASSRFGDSAKRVGPNGIEPQADYPTESGQWIENIGSKLDGAGMCVFSSFEMMCRYHGVESFRGFRDWCAAKYEGGGYPSKLAQLVIAYCHAKNIKEPGWWQYEGPLDNKAAQMIEKYLRSGRMACTTLYFDKRYGSQKIFHMVCLPHFEPQRFAILDNNFDDVYQWSTFAEAKKKLADGSRIWVVGLLEPGPPPVPYN